jgi:hypothetical protein
VTKKVVGVFVRFRAPLQLKHRLFKNLVNPDGSDVPNKKYYDQENGYVKAN